MNPARRGNVADWSNMTNKLRQICDVPATSQIGRRWRRWRPCDVTGWSKIDEWILTNLQRRSDVAYWSKITNKFRWIRHVAATSQIGRIWRIDCDESATSLRRRKLVEDDEDDVTATSQIGRKLTNKFQRICDVADWSKMTNNFRRIYDVAGTSQLVWNDHTMNLRRRCDVAGWSKWWINFDESATLLRRRRLVEKD